MKNSVMNNKGIVLFICVLSTMLMSYTSLVTASEKWHMDVPLTDQRMELQSAYQREYAYLVEQQRNLLKRLAKLKSETRATKKTLSSQVEQLSQSFRQLQDESKNLNDLFFESELTLESARDNKNSFSSTFEQAGQTLKSHDIHVGIADDVASNEKVGVLMGHAFEMLESVRSLRKVPGSFFAENGERVDGQLLHIGQIATYGMSDKAKGILVPAGNGEFKLWSQPASAVTASLFSGEYKSEHTDQLDIFIYENRFTEVNASASESIVEYINSGGMVGWIIVILGGLAVLLIILRSAFLKSASSATEKILSGIKSHVVSHDIEAAQDICKKFKGSTSRVVSATLRNLKRDRDHLEDIIAESILHESTVLNRFGAIIIVIAAVTPLLGLLGTVTGMISTFDIITEFGTGDPKLLSGGISVALVTTQLGLIVAIPALVLGNLLSGWSNRIKDDMEKAALNIINIYDAPQIVK